MLKLLKLRDIDHVVLRMRDNLGGQTTRDEPI
jgi:hypothetical protein